MEKRKSNDDFCSNDVLNIDLGLMQQKDDDIRKIRDELMLSETPAYELPNGLVYRKHGNKMLFYVPKSMETNVIRTYHEDIGRVGTEKVCELIFRTYWFPNMRENVKTHIKNCLKCILCLPKSGKIEGILHPVPKGNVPFETIHCDHYGPLEKTGKKHRYIFEVVAIVE